MRYKLALISTLLMGCCLIGCEKGILDYDNANGNAVIVKPANATKADSGTLTKDGTLVYSIGSVFVGGGIADPSKGSSHRCHFYQEKFTEGPRWDQVEALVTIYGFRHNGISITCQGSTSTRLLLMGSMNHWDSVLVLISPWTKVSTRVETS